MFKNFKKEQVLDFLKKNKKVASALGAGIAAGALATKTALKKGADEMSDKVSEV